MSSEQVERIKQYCRSSIVLEARRAARRLLETPCSPKNLDTCAAILQQASDDLDQVSRIVLEATVTR